MRDILIGLDSGTSAIKAVAFAPDGSELGRAMRRNIWTPGPGGAATQDMARTFADAAAVLQDLAGAVPGLRERAAALGVTAQGDGCWLIDAAGDPVGEGLLWLDTRAAGIVERLQRRPEERARFAATGTGLTACMQGPQLAWMLAHEPERIARAATAFHAKDWLYFRLTGQRATDPCEAAFSFGNFRTRAYDEGVIAALEMEGLRHLLPPILDGAAETHGLAVEAAAATGLPAGLPVALGYLDAACTALGAGVHAGGQGYGCTIMGSTGVHMRAMPAEAVTLGEEPAGYVLVLPVPGQVAMMQTNMSGTLNLDWVMALAGEVAADLGAPAPDPWARLDPWLQAARPGALVYQPYISPAGERGPFVNPRARAGFAGLTERHRFPDLVRAVAEALGLAARDCYGAMGGVPAEVRLTGGAARSPALRGVMAAALGVPVRRSLREEAGAAGAAMIAAVATGAFSGMEACIAAWVTPRLAGADAPDPEEARRMEGLYAAYRLAREALPPVWDDLARGG